MVHEVGHSVLAGIIITVLVRYTAQETLIVDMWIRMCSNYNHIQFNTHNLASP